MACIPPTPLNSDRSFTVIIAVETALVILFLSVVALGIALLGDHIAQILSRNDPWPTVKARRAAATIKQRRA